MANELFGKNIKRMREERDLSMQELADFLGVSKSSVNMWENAGVIPRESILKKISKSFNVSIDYLLGNINKEQEVQNRKREREIDLAIQEFLGCLDEEDLDKMISVIKLVVTGKDINGFDKIEQMIREKHYMCREAKKYGATIGLEYTEEDNIQFWKDYKRLTDEDNINDEDYIDEIFKQQ